MSLVGGYSRLWFNRGFCYKVARGLHWQSRQQGAGCSSESGESDSLRLGSKCTATPPRGLRCGTRLTRILDTPPPQQHPPSINFLLNSRFESCIFNVPCSLFLSRNSAMASSRPPSPSLSRVGSGSPSPAFSGGYFSVPFERFTRDEASDWAGAFTLLGM